MTMHDKGLDKNSENARIIPTAVMNGRHVTGGLKKSGRRAPDTRRFPCSKNRKARFWWIWIY
jgi:hypothetical protein